MSGNEAMELLLNSERVYEDLQHGLNYVSNYQKMRNDLPSEKIWNVNIIIRKWSDFDISSEFRVFVYQNEITAITQYFDMLYFPEIVTNKSNIEKKIRKFFSSIKNFVNFENYVIDFAVLNIDKEYKENDVIIIEFNPFTKFTSSCLFDKSEYDGLFKVKNI